MVKRFVLLTLISLFLLAGLPEVEAQDVHDVAVVNITNKYPYGGGKGIFPIGWSVNVSVTVRNKGDFNETFNVTAYANTTIIGTKLVIDLAPGENKTLTFIWGVPWPEAWWPYPPIFTIWAEAEVVDGETDIGDNTFVDGSVELRFPGDANGDGKVDWKDLLLYVAPAYGKQFGDPGYTSYADFDCDGKVGWRDVLLHLAPNYGWSVVGP